MACLRLYSLSYIFILCNLQLLRVSCADDDYRGSVDDIIIEFVNDTYIDEDSFELAVNYKDDGNSITIRVDVINELPSQIFMKLKVLARALGQYKVPTGISMDVDICDGKLKRYLLDSILSKIGVDMKDCPPKPGSYGIKDYMLKMDGVPLYALPGLNILVDVELHSPPDITIMKVKGYGRVF